MKNAVKNIRELKEFLLDILFPPRCIHCGTHLRKSEKDSWLCHTCENHIVIYSTLFCSVCGARLPENKKVCHKNSSYLLAAATKYDGPARSLIRQFKYSGWPSLSKKIGRYLEKYIRNSSLIAKNNLIVPIPLHPSKLKERGFNQAEKIAEEIGIALGIPVLKEGLVRKKKTSAQAEIQDHRKRKENVAGAFEVSDPEKIRNKNLIIVDDVFTSGATMNEAVRTLRSAKAKKVMAFVIAKTK